MNEIQSLVLAIILCFAGIAVGLIMIGLTIWEYFL